MQLTFSKEQLLELESKSSLGCAESAMSLAEYLRYNGGDHKKIEDLYLLAIEQGSSIAAMALASLYERELKNEIEAIHWYKVACEAGQSLACSRLALAYLAGDLSLPADSAMSKKYSALASKIEGEF